MIRRLITFLITAVVLAGCDLIDYHPYDARIRTDTEINRKNIERIESACEGRDTIRFIMMGDSQRWYDETVDFVDNVNRRGDIDFVIHGGDIADFGMTLEFKWMHDILSGLDIPYVAVVGNHDLLGNGLAVYTEMYGDLNFSFTAARTKFVCLNTNALEFDYGADVPDFTFIKSELEADRESYDRTIPVMHARPKSDQFSDNVADYFHYMLRQFNGLMFCLHAHDHGISAADIFDDGIIYYGCGCMKDRTYLLFEVTSDGYEYEVVEY
ncbi:MAG: metallophosphoesterase [Rikenellaceae bacterium]|nr:metallophosphoesterase [Rikenellaceae bacterium]